jgi:L-ascorbate metabolism protein UlaG (beta-lactamase superfamily)
LSRKLVARPTTQLLGATHEHLGDQPDPYPHRALDDAHRPRRQIILTDPWVSEKWGYYHGEPYGVTLDQLPHLAAVIVSHGHYDHYDMQAFQAYPDKSVPMFVKRGIAKAARDVGFTNVTEMDAWETAAIGPLTLTAAPGKHAVPEITYIIDGEGRTVYFGGDTLLIPELKTIAQRFPSIDLAILAVNGLILRPLLNRQVVMKDSDE